jgi:hypothetical protein
MHGKTPAMFIATSLIAALPYAASAAPLVGGAGLDAIAETLSPAEPVHYYGYYGRGYYGRGYYGRGYYGYGRGYYGYGRGYYGHGYYPYGRGYYGYRYY